jgi:diguanylate cyclase (GGDEF)-like protein
MENLDPGSLCPRLNFCPDTDCLCVPISISGEMLGILSLCCDHGQPVDTNNGKGNHTIETKRMALTRVAEHYALSLVNLRLRETLRMECIRDPLTGLYNRRYMEESLEREARRAKRHNMPIGIIMLDIDHFKHFNDIFGHEAGDIVLKELGSFLRAHTRGEDIACRYGGEEFLLILPETPLKVVAQRAKELHAGVKKLKIVYRGRLLHITISAGVAVLPNHSSEVKEVVKAADVAMYRAKENGRNQVVLATS